jgi:3-oxoadipate enol-lactonase
MKAKVNGITIDYRDGGDGLPVVFIHAFPLNQTMWDEQIEALSGVCRTITLDLRGFGASDLPAGPYWMAQMACDVRSLMYDLHIERCVLVGLSMGGYAAMAFYRNFPDSVSALVLADTRAAADNQEGRERRLQMAVRAETEGLASIADEMTRVLLGPSTLAGRPDIVERVRAMMMSTRPEGFAAAQRGMAARPDSMAMLSGIKCPTLVIGGRDDSLSLPAVAEAMQARITQSRVRIVEGAGHLSNMEQPEAFNEALGEFIVSLKR